jgi:hypothetical protein
VWRGVAESGKTAIEQPSKQPSTPAERGDLVEALAGARYRLATMRSPSAAPSRASGRSPLLAPPRRAIPCGRPPGGLAGARYRPSTTPSPRPRPLGPPAGSPSWTSGQRLRIAALSESSATARLPRQARRPPHLLAGRPLPFAGAREARDPPWVQVSFTTSVPLQ